MIKKICNSKWFSNIIAIIAFIFSIIAFTSPSYEYRDTHKEKIIMMSNPNSICEVQIKNSSNLSNVEYVYNFLNEYLSSNKHLSDFGIEISKDVDVNIYNNSDKTVTIADSHVFKTDNSEDLKKIFKYETLIQSNKTANDKQNLKNFYYGKITGVLVKNNNEGGLNNYTINSGESDYKSLKINLFVDEDMEAHIKNYIREHKSDEQYNFNNITINPIDNSCFYSRGLNSLFANAIYDYCRSKEMPINYTYVIITSRGTLVSSLISLFIS